MNRRIFDLCKEIAAVNSGSIDKAIDDARAKMRHSKSGSYYYCYPKLITEETGGDPNIRDIALLDSALESAFQTFGGQELYPTKEEKGARIGYSLISNHAFVDGNKRIGMYVLLTFLETNGIKINPTVDDVARVGLAVAAGEMKYEDLLAWILKNKK